MADCDDNLLTSNKRTTRNNLTHHPEKRRRDAKKKASSRKFFPKQRLERIEDDDVSFIQPIDHDVAENATSLSDAITIATPPYPIATSPTPIPSKSPRNQSQIEKSNVGTISYKFQNYF